MAEPDKGRFTAGVFQDAAWAEKGIDALRRQGFPPEALSLVAADKPEAAAMAERVFGGPPARTEVRGLGQTVATGPLIAAIDGETGDLSRLGLSATMGRVGFQPHDCQIFEALTARGGVLVAVRGEARAADALATLHSYGAGNAAIGAWTGRL
ncbi:MAG: hypothetical protein ACE148_01640 [Vicinamibacterales bacterium]